MGCFNLFQRKKEFKGKSECAFFTSLRNYLGIFVESGIVEVNPDSARQTLIN